MVKKSAPVVNEDELFQGAVDALCTPTSHQQIADEMDCSIAMLRAALRDRQSTAYRKPPGGWQLSVRKLLLKRAAELAICAEKLNRRE